MRIILALFVSLLAASVAAAQEKDDKAEASSGKMVIKSVAGVRFELPEDRPIEKKHSIFAPMAIDQYVALKFEKVEGRLQAVEKAVESLKDDIDAVKKELDDLLEGPNAQPAPPKEVK